MSKFEMQQDEIFGKIYDGRLFSRLIRYVKPYSWHLIIAFTLLLMNTAGELILPLLTRHAVDTHIVPDDKVISMTQAEYEEFINAHEIEKFKVYQYTEFKYDDANEYTETAMYSVIVNSRNSAYLTPKTREKYKSDIDTRVLIIDTKDLMGKGHIFEKIKGQYQKLGLRMTADGRQIDWHKAKIVDTDNYLETERLIYIPLEMVNELLDAKERMELRNKSVSAIVYIGIIYLAIILIKFVIGFFQLVLTTTAAQRAMHDLRSRLFSHLERMPVSFFDKNPVGRLVTRVTSDIAAINELLASGVITILQDFVIVVAIMVLMLFLNWKLALVSFAMLPIVIMLISVFKNKTRNSYRAMRKYLAQVNATLAEHISGVKIIQLFNQYKNKHKDFDSSNDNYYDASMLQMKLFAIFRPLVVASRNIATAIVLWYAGGQILENVLTLGLFMAFISYMDRLYEPISNFTDKFNILQGAMAGAERIFDLKDQAQAEYREDLTPVEKINGEIEFKNVWLTYNPTPDTQPPTTDNYVLKNISFKVRPGEKIALVGHTGSGKTSIVNLILNMYPYQKGEILVNGRNINEYRLCDLRANIGMVQQDVFLFSGNIRENIILNNKNISDDEIYKIAEYVNVADFINSLPGKLDEPVQERGATLSVGQRQLISFARVLAYDPAIFILDEATSNIDTETEILIQDALFKIMEHRTSIIIAHRLSTIQNVDRIIVLHHGEIAEEGSHQELLKKEGLYYDLYRLQYS